MRVIIDRIEGDVSVVEIDENGTMLSVPSALFGDAEEGDTVEITVLGKIPPEGTESPHDIFERLRKKSRRRKHHKPSAHAAENTPDPTLEDTQKVETT